MCISGVVTHNLRCVILFSAMKWLNNIVQRFAPPKRSDQKFGPMIYMGDKAGYWEGIAVFPPTGDKVEYFIDGNTESDFAVQHANLDHVCAHWQQLAHDLQPMLESSALRENMPAKKFVVTAVSLPHKPITAAPEWQITFVRAGDTKEEVLFNAKMKGLAPIQIYVD
jgi:hypothetical protein